MIASAHRSTRAESDLLVWRSLSAREIVFHRGTAISHRFPRHWHDELHICAYTGGAGHLASRGRFHHINRGDFVIMPPAQVHENWVEPGSTISFRGAYIRLDLLREPGCAFHRHLGPLSNLSGAALHHPTLTNKFLQVYRAVEQKASRLECDELFLTFFDLLALTCGLHTQPQPVGREHRAVAKVREYIDAHFADAISLSQLGSIAQLSPFHLQRVFRHHAGLSPHAYQTQLRINYAKSLLRWGQPLCEVAMATGFADQSHLTRHFRRLVGITPGRYTFLLTPHAPQDCSRRTAPAHPTITTEAALGG